MARPGQLLEFGRWSSVVVWVSMRVVVVGDKGGGLRGGTMARPGQSVRRSSPSDDEEGWPWPAGGVGQRKMGAREARRQREGRVFQRTADSMLDPDLGRLSIMCWNGVLQVDYDNEFDNNKLLGGGMPAWQVRSCPARTRTAFIPQSNSNSNSSQNSTLTPCVDRTRNPHLSHHERGD